MNHLKVTFEDVNPYSSFNPEKPIGIFDTDDSVIMADDPECKFDCFYVDNNLKMMFTGLRSAHTAFRARMMLLTLVSHQKYSFRQLFFLDSLKMFELADIYTALGHCIYESAAMGGGRTVCGQRYPFFLKPRQKL